MKTILQFLIPFTLLSLQALSQINVAIIKPTQFARDSLQIVASVESPKELTSVIASIGSLQAPLKFNPNSNYFEGYLLLNPADEGDSLSLSVTATDYLGAVKSTSRKLLYDNPPKILYRQHGITATPLVKFKVKVKDKDSCILKVFETDVDNYYPYLVFTGKIKDSVEREFDWSKHFDFEGEPKQSVMYFEVADSSKQTASTLFELNNTSVILFIPSDNPGLTPFYRPTYGYNIMDFSGGKIFTRDNFFGNVFNYRIVDIKNGKETIPYSFDIASFPGTPFLTDYGAVFGKYDWNNEILDSIQGTFLKASGNYAAWIFADSVYLRFLSTKKDSLVTAFASHATTGFFYDLAPNGLFAYNDSSNNLFTYKNGITTRITTDIGKQTHPGLATDGNYVVYFKTPSSIYFYDGSTNNYLSDVGDAYVPDPTHRYLFKCENKYIAFCKNDFSAHRQVWLRDPSGNLTQLTHFGSNSYIVSLNEMGDVIITNDDKYYIVPKNGVTKMFGGGGNYYYQDSSWYTTIGDVIFKVSADFTLPVNLISFDAVNKGKFNGLTWQTSSEINTDIFEVLRRNTTGDFLTIGSVKASGDNGTSKNYSFTDKQPLTGINAYRLKIIDKDGRYNFSQIKTVNNGFSGFRVYLNANPVKDYLQIQYTLDKKLKLFINILDVNGARIFSMQDTQEKGTYNKQLEIGNFAAGTYFLHITTDQGQQTVLKFLKQ